MKTELVNLVTKDGTQTVVLLSTDLQVLKREEKARGVPGDGHSTSRR